MTVSSETLAELIANHPKRRDMRFMRGETVFQPTSSQTNFFIVLSGFVKGYSIDDQGNSSTLIFYSTGDVFPLYWLIGRSNNASVYFSALTECQVAVIPQADMTKLIDTNPAVSARMLRQVAEQFAIYATRVGTLGFKYGRDRLAHTLLFLAFRFGEHAGNRVTLPAFSQQDIAEAINMSRESVNRELSKLEAAGQVATGSGRTVIVDLPALRASINMDETLYFDG